MSKLLPVIFPWQEKLTGVIKIKC